MRNVMPFLAVLSLAAVFATGCAGPEQKLGRGMSNTFEAVRMGELRRSVEQTTVFEGPDVGYTTGFVTGLDRTLVRTGVGVYEVVTFPIPPYHPVLTHYMSPTATYPDSYKPSTPASTTLDTDTYVGFSGGVVAPWIPGNRFDVYDN